MLITLSSAHYAQQCAICSAVPMFLRLLVWIRTRPLGQPAKGRDRVELINVLHKVDFHCSVDVLIDGGNSESLERILIRQAENA